MQAAEPCGLGMYAGGTCAWGRCTWTVCGREMYVKLALIVLKIVGRYVNLYFGHPVMQWLAV